jgi:hypothetical protein
MPGSDLMYITYWKSTAPYWARTCYAVTVANYTIGYVCKTASGWFYGKGTATTEWGIHGYRTRRGAAVGLVQRKFR